MSSTQVDEAVGRAKRLVDLYEQKRVAERTLVVEIAGSVTPENFRDVMEALPPRIHALFRDWVRTLPDDDGKTIIFWPLDSDVERCFKEWLREQEKIERGDH